MDVLDHRPGPHEQEHEQPCHRLEERSVLVVGLVERRERDCLIFARPPFRRMNISSAASFTLVIVRRQEGGSLSRIRRARSSASLSAE